MFICLLILYFPFRSYSTHVMVEYTADGSFHSWRLRPSWGAINFISSFISGSEKISNTTWFSGQPVIISLRCLARWTLRYVVSVPYTSMKDKRPIELLYECPIENKALEQSFVSPPTSLPNTIPPSPNMSSMFSSMTRMGTQKDTNLSLGKSVRRKLSEENTACIPLQSNRSTWPRIWTEGLSRRWAVDAENVSSSL